MEQNINDKFSNINTFNIINSHNPTPLYIPPAQKTNPVTNQNTATSSTSTTNSVEMPIVSGRCFGILRNPKTICVYDPKELQTLFVIIKCKKTVSKFIVECKNNKCLLIVADKSGIVTEYECDFNGGPAVKSRVLLGHISMLTDIVLSLDRKFLITCDRDEKIRVSHFPQTFDIQSFCMGHSRFISSIRVAPNHPNVLFSSSGDGNIKIWDFPNGLCLHTHSLNNKFDGAGPQMIIKMEINEIYMCCLTLTNSGEETFIVCSYKINENQTIDTRTLLTLKCDDNSPSTYFDDFIILEDVFDKEPNCLFVLFQFSIRNKVKMYLKDLNPKVSYKVLKIYPDKERLKYDLIPNDAQQKWNMELYKKILSYKGSEHYINLIKTGDEYDESEGGDHCNKKIKA